MKKFLPYILIVLIFVQLLAPFSVDSGIKNNLEIKINKTEAANGTFFHYLYTNNSDPTSQIQSDAFPELESCETARSVANPVTGYTVSASCVSFTNQLGPTAQDPNPELTGDVDGLPTCSIWPGNFHLGGCIAQAIYYLFFKTTSFLFAGAGKVLDFTLMYSISDTSYRSSFVVQGWGIVRDFCNMFFIFVLLYIAFGTILKLHSVKTKEMIISVVIIGLLINFSLFATQIIIDASNILTRVFYNQKTIITGAQQIDANGNPVFDANGKPLLVNELGQFGEIKLSEAIVSKVDPQKLIIQASKVSTIKIAGEEEETYGDNDISVGSFILVTILATIVNVVGIIAFITSAIIFIARVIGLWLAMILAPIAFFTYTVPALQDMEMIGWKRWWPETLKLAFLAPIFAFFMYLIVGFMPKALDVFKGGSTAEFSGINFVVGIVVPFIFIMILLMKSKDIAKSMSGKIGQSITNGISAVGGVALGAGIGGLAMAGRQTIGRLATNASQSNMMRDWAGKSKIGASALKMTSGVASKSFDFRATKLGGMAGKELGTDLGKAKSGGFAKTREEKIHKEEEFAKKLLDTSDYGMAELRGGNISETKAKYMIKKILESEDKNKINLIKDTNGNILNSSNFRVRMRKDAKLSRLVADQMDSDRRSARSKNFENNIFVTNKIAANKIRKDPNAIAKAREQATILTQLSDQIKKSEEAKHKKEESKTPATEAHPAPAAASEKHDTHEEGHGH